MNRAKNEIVASIARAKLELEDALEELKDMPMLDPMILGFIVHAMNNYLHVSRVAEDRPRLFQRGAKLKSRPAGNEPLTSHGLAVAAELGAHLGGEIGCESNSHKGASFFFRLPCPRTRSTSKRRAHRTK